MSGVLELAMRRVSIVLIPLLLLPAAAETRSQSKSFSDLKKWLGRSLEAGAAGNAEVLIGRIGTLDSRAAAEYLTDLGLKADRIRSMDEGGKLRVYLAARDSLRKMTGREAREYIFEQALGKREDLRERRVILADVVGRMDGADAEKTLLSLLSSSESRAVKVVALRAVRMRRIKAALPVLIEMLGEREDDPDLLWQAVLETLRDITGEEFDRAAAWRKFWEEKGPTFDPDSVSRDHRGRDPERTVSRAFDPKTILSKRAVFVIDVSASMHIKDPPQGGEQPTPPKKTRERKRPGEKGPAGPDEDEEKDEICPVCGQRHGGQGLPDSRMRIERVKRDLIKLIRSLTPDVKFNIVAFSQEIVPWVEGDRLLPATPGKREDAIAWVKKLTYQRCTCTDYALRKAFSYPEANAIYLLSDGRPYRGAGYLRTEPILVEVAWVNRLRSLQIFTYGFSKDADEKFMRRLARENGGTFTAVR